MNTANFEPMQQIAHEQHQMLLAEARREQWLGRSNRVPTTFWNKIWRGAIGFRVSAAKWMGIGDLPAHVTEIYMQ